MPCLEIVTKFSLKNGLNVHSSVGGKYGELLVAHELWSHEPKLGLDRYKVEGMEKPGSCDIILASTRKKIEVKWGMLHQEPEDRVVKRVEGIPF